MKNGKQFITLLFVTLFLLIKVAGLHAISHLQDDSELQHCELCDVTTAVNFIPLLKTEDPTLKKADYFFNEQKANAQIPTGTLSNSYLSNYLFTRPPPYATISFI